MPVSQPNDRLIHILLLEELGGQAPPDLADRVLQRTLNAPRRRLRLWVPAAAAAAVILAIGGLAIFGPWSYPSPTANGNYSVVEGGGLRRGAVICTQDAAAEVVLGGYCRVDLGPQTRLRLQGRDRAEEVFLETGSALCEVDRNIGTFVVRTEVGTVSVTGTKFTVRILESEGDPRMCTKRMAVKVLVGAVLLSGAWGNVALSAGNDTMVVAAPPQANLAQMSTTARVTITGMSKALGDPKAKMDPAVANAIVTVAADNTQVDYYVYGWAGVICATRADGKKVEVTGVVGEKDGKKTITGKSVDVKIIVVEESPPK
jgi:hypothetical protein